MMRREAFQGRRWAAFFAAFAIFVLSMSVAAGPVMADTFSASVAGITVEVLDTDDFEDTVTVDISGIGNFTYTERTDDLIDVTTDFSGTTASGTGLTEEQAVDFVIAELKKVLLGSSNSQTAGASGLSTTQNTQNTVFDNVIAPRTPTRLETKEREAEKEEGKTIQKLPSSVGALMKFESFSFAGRSGFKFGTTFGYEYEEDRIRAGILLPYDFVKSNDANLEFHRLGPVPYANYALLTEGPDPLTLRLGAFASLIGVMNAGTSSGNNTVTFSGGPSISAEKEFKAVIVKGLIDSFITTFGFGFTFSSNNQKDSKVQSSIKTGLNVGVPIGDNYVANVYTNYNVQVEPDSLDNDYYNLGGELSVYFTRLISATAGFKTVLGLDDFTSYEGYLGAILKF